MLERASGPSAVRATPNSSSTSPSAAVPLSSPSRMMVITGRVHSDAVRDQLPDIIPSNLLVEPTPKESAAAIGLAAAVLARRDHREILGRFVANHMINGTMLS